MGFQWITLDGCAVCLSLDGLFDDEPARPHVNCDCEIFEDLDGIDAGECWGELDGDLLILTEPLRIVTFVEVTRICPDGQEVSDHFEIEESLDEYIDRLDDPDVWAVAYQAMHAHIDGMCANELEWRCSEFVVPDP